ncbi:MAG: beta-ketoacyl-ACP synthase II [Bacteroidales bacterium]|jgi:3-oxoacyl-[acyl-carrier-protein] synthase II|nr:beta-ketoacyl-ACP synthase II [Bacteroidales bacterium]
MKLRRVVITGLGALTPIGNDCPTFWENLLSGVSGAGPITRFDASCFRTRFACEVKQFDILRYVNLKESRKMDLFTQFAVAAADEAIEMSRLKDGSTDLKRVGVIFSTGMGGCGSFYEESKDLDMQDPKLSPFFVTRVISDIASGHIAIRHGFMGLNYSISSACASSANAIADAFTNIRIGKADAIIAGGAEAPITPPGVLGFNASHALSTRNEEPEKASRPFDRDRDGFVMGEGAGALVLEEYEHAIRRGAPILAEIVGSGMSADAYHITLPHPEGIGAALSMRYALEDAGITTDEVGFINTHGTSTPAGDLAEINAIRTLFGEGMSKVALTSNKSAIGHLLGAAGAVEAIATVFSLREGIIPPTCNVENLDEKMPPEMQLVRDKAQKKDIRYALSNSFGFGGHNITLLLKRYDEQ